MEILTANWPAPSAIHAFTTTRGHGAQPVGYAHFNLADHVGDDPNSVAANRHHLQQTYQLPNEPFWLNQIHSTTCIRLDGSDVNRDADAAITHLPNTVLAIMTADCLPILLCHPQTHEVAAIHAGWRGLMNGIIEETVSQLQSSPHEYMAWIGPAICGQCYATGEEVWTQFSQRYAFAQHGFHQIGTQWYADLPKLATLILQQQAITQVYFSRACTYELNNQYYSYRREPQTGRIATLIWFQD